MITSERLYIFPIDEDFETMFDQIHFEEDQKGTLEEGKLADMVILDKNPLKISPTEIKEIVVLETIKEGISVYKKK